jgi:hypothetical protein
MDLKQGITVVRLGNIQPGALGSLLEIDENSLRPYYVHWKISRAGEAINIKTWVARDTIKQV